MGKQGSIGSQGRPAASRPAASRPAGARPAASRPAASRPAASRPRRLALGRRALLATVAGVALVVATPSVGGATPLQAAAHTGTRGRAAMVPQVLVAKSPRLPDGATHVGSLPAGRVVRGVVGLTPRNAAALGRFASAISTPGTSAYHHYLAPAAFTSYFSPSRAAVAAVERDLRAGGLTVSSVSSNRLLVGFTGRAAAVAATFHTTFGTYRLAGGRRAFANTSAVSLPATVAPLVAAVVGLNDLVVPQATPVRPATKPAGSARERAAALHAAQTASTTSGGPVACRAATRVAAGNDGLTDTQIADAYGVNGLYQAGAIGAGQTVAVYELEPYRTVDVKAFDSCYFGAAAASSMLTRLRTVAVDGGIPSGPGSGESELDIDVVSALAPGADIEVYEAPQTNVGYLDDWNAIVSADTAKTVSSSWGSGCETGTAVEEPGLEQVENTIFQQAAVQGQTVLDAAGDAGSDGCSFDTGTPTTPLLSADDPASQPYVLAVGGTTIDRPTDPPVEQTWNDGAEAGAGGGGISAVWPQPAWQADSTVAGMDAAKVIGAAERVSGGDFCQTAEVKTACRELPDVSANADEYTGITIEYDGGWTTIGGTSSSTPLWAAMLADIDSTPSCKAHGGVGFADPSLYAVASVPVEYKASFNDITTADNDEYGIADGLYPATRGYDMATGLGSPRVTGPSGTHGLAYYLCASPATARPTVSSLSPDVVSSAAGSGSGVAGAPVTVTITGSHFETGGAPDVAGITVGSYQVTPFTVVNSSTITASLPIAMVEEGNGGQGDGSGVFDVTVTLNGGLSSVPTSSARLTVYNDPADADQSVPVVDAVTPSGGNEAGGTVIHVYGSGFTAESQTSTVTVGGVKAAITKVTDTELTAVVPAYAASGPSATTCATAKDPANDVCQTEVEVTNHFGSSATAPILPEYSGELGAPTDGTETVAATTEFDYVPTPTVTSFTFTAPSQTYASEEGFSYVSFVGNEVIVHGTGLGELGFEWADVGTPGTSAAVDDEIVSVTPTAIDMLLPNIRLTDRQTVDALAMQTLGSPNQASLSSRQEPSASVPVTYAPVPKLTSYTTPSGKDFSPTAGGTKVSVKGSGFVDGPFALFTNNSTFSMGTDYNLDFSPTSPQSEFSFVTTPQLAGQDGFSVCTVSGCSGDQEVCVPGICIVGQGGSGHLFTFYPPGKPSLLSIHPKTGRARIVVTITGTNLAFPQAVYFGSTKLKSEDFTNGFNFNTGATETNVVLALVPRGLHIGTKLDIRVVTAESEATERYPETPINKNVTFTVTSRYRAGGP